MTTKLSAKDICDIIDSCKRSGVVQFKIDKLCINFENQYNNQLPVITAGFSPKTGPNNPEEKLDKEAELLDELMLSNPSAYEDVLNARESDGFDPKDHRGIK